MHYIYRETFVNLTLICKVHTGKSSNTCEKVFLNPGPNQNLTKQYCTTLLKAWYSKIFYCLLDFQYAKYDISLVQKSNFKIYMVNTFEW